MTEPLNDAYRRYFPLLRGKCRRMLRTAAEAEDVAQEAFVRLQESGLLDRGAFGDPKQVCAWLYKTSTRLAIDRLRRPTLAAIEEAPDCRVTVDEDACLDARRSLFRIAKTADGDALEAAVLCRLDGLGQDEAARVLGCSERTVRRLLARFDEHRLDKERA
jgi:RNA polymerase sigma-70 factor (ECF subfamily)